MSNKVYGNVQGLKKEELKALEGLFDTPQDRHLLVTPETARLMAAITERSKREIAVFLDRKGRVVSVGVGDDMTAPLVSDNLRRGEFRLSGVRCIHTHPTGNSELSTVDFSALLTMRLDAMVALGVEKGRVKEASAAFLDPQDGAFTNAFQTIGPLTEEDLSELPFLPLLDMIEGKIRRPLIATEGKREGERAILVGLDRGGEGWSVEESLDELAQLAETAGAKTMARITQKKARPDPALFIGIGKVREISLLRQDLDVNLIIFDDELSPAQTRNLERELGCRVIDRTALILDIFAQRAQTREGKLQVELAQLHYLLPRLTGLGAALSRLGGGIGTRGPGETKLETDRRHIRRRIGELSRALEQVRSHRSRQRENRQGFPLPVVALVGYTNAGKSTLLNTLTQSEVLAEDKLFATLDPTTRRLELPNNQVVLLTDTVGFIRKLPHHLVAAFRATLEEVVEADLLLHVVDASHPGFEEQMASVEKVLKELKAHDKKTIVVFNKLDAVKDPGILHQTTRLYPLTAEISARTGQGLEGLKELIAEHTPIRRRRFTALIPYTRGDLASLVHNRGHVIEERYEAEGIWLDAEGDDALRAAVSAYLKEEQA